MDGDRLAGGRCRANETAAAAVASGVAAVEKDPTGVTNPMGVTMGVCMTSTRLLLVVFLAVTMTVSVVALPLAGSGLGSTESDDEPVTGEVDTPASNDVAASNDSPTAPSDLARGEQSLGVTEATGGLQEEQTDAVGAGVEAGIEAAESQGVEVTDEVREAAIAGAETGASQHTEAEDDDIEAAAAGAVHGALIADETADADRIESGVAGATDGGLSQSGVASATQIQSATWGATHGALAHGDASPDEIDVATRGAAAGATETADEYDVDSVGMVQEAAQGAAYGAIDRFSSLTAEQAQEITLEHVEGAAAGAAAGALEGTTEDALAEDPKELERHQEVTIKQVQRAAMGAAEGALVGKQTVSVEATQAAARGGGSGVTKGVQSVDLEAIQTVEITQIQKAAFGGAKGAVTAEQVQQATVEQVLFAADGAAGGVLASQEVSVTQVQKAAVGAAKGAVDGAIQHQVVEVEGVQAAAFGAGEGAVVQQQIVSVTQVQVLAEAGASGVLVGAQEATVGQIQAAAVSACTEAAHVVQYQRVSITQLQLVVSDTAAATVTEAIEAGVDDPSALIDAAQAVATEAAEEAEEPDGEARVTVADQNTTGESVIVDDVELSEGGFVAIYDESSLSPDEGVFRGVSAYLEPGEHEDVEIELDEPIENDTTLYAAAHLDTTDDEAFAYVESEGEEDELYVTDASVPVFDSALVTVDPEAPEPDPEEPDPEEPDPEEPDDVIDSAPDAVDALEVVDYEIVGDDPDEEFVTFANVEDRPVELTGWTLQDRFDEGLVDTEGVSAYEFPDGFALDPGEEATLVTGSGEDTDDTLHWGVDRQVWNETGDTVVIFDADGEVVLEAPLEPEPVDPTAELVVADQEGDGETLLVDEANASVAYHLEVTDEDGDVIGESEEFEANQGVDAFDLPLDPPLEADGPLIVGVIETETGETLETEPVEYTVEAPPASIAFDDQVSDGTAVDVSEVDLPEGGSIEIHDETALEEITSESLLGTSPALDPGVSNDVGVDLDEALDPGEVPLVAVATDEEGEPYLVDGEPVLDDALVTVEVDDEPVDDEPVDDEPVDDEPVDDEPVDDEPVDDEPEDDEPVDDEPEDDESVDDEPADDEPEDDASGEQ